MGGNDNGSDGQTVAISNWVKQMLN